MRNVDDNLLRRRVQPDSFKSSRLGWVIVAFIFVASLSYYAGTFHNQIIGGFKGVFGEDVVLDTSSLQETYTAIQEHFDGKIDTQLLIDGANRGMVDALGDEYTNFMTKSDTEEFNKSLSGDIGGGIGVEIGLRGGRPTIVRVLRDNPADEVGLRAGDILVSVNGDSVVGSSVSDAVAKIRGDEGTSVKLVVVRDGKEQSFAITRAKVNNPSVYSSIKNDIGVMTITRFDNETGNLARRAAQEFKNAGVRGVVLDLRGNGGGYVEAAKVVASIWLDDKVVVVEKAGGRVVDEVRSQSNPTLLGVKTVVLVNESSASASEIVAGALRDHKAATIIGQTSFGKGSVQRLVDLSGGATLKVTIARWYTPGGVNISEKGIVPDVDVENTAKDVDSGVDPQLDAALDYLSS